MFSLHVISYYPCPRDWFHRFLPGTSWQFILQTSPGNKLNLLVRLIQYFIVSVFPWAEYDHRVSPPYRAICRILSTIKFFKSYIIFFGKSLNYCNKYFSFYIVLVNDQLNLFLDYLTSRLTTQVIRWWLTGNVPHLTVPDAYNTCH